MRISPSPTSGGSARARWSAQRPRRRGAIRALARPDRRRDRVPGGVGLADPAWPAVHRRDAPVRGRYRPARWPQASAARWPQASAARWPQASAARWPQASLARGSDRMPVQRAAPRRRSDSRVPGRGSAGSRYPGLGRCSWCMRRCGTWAGCGTARPRWWRRCGQAVGRTRHARGPHGHCRQLRIPHGSSRSRTTGMTNEQMAQYKAGMPPFDPARTPSEGMGQLVGNDPDDSRRGAQRPSANVVRRPRPEGA